MDQTIRLCVRCEGKTSSGNRCKRNTCDRYKYCWQHLKSVKGLSIQKSQIPNSGKGLFAHRDMKKGELITYSKTPVSCDKIDEIYPGDMLASYAYADRKKNVCWDGASTQSGYGRYANDGKVSGKGVNAKFFVKKKNGKKFLYLKLTKNIKKGTEILIDYGQEYWKDSS